MRTRRLYLSLSLSLLCLWFCLGKAQQQVLHGIHTDALVEGEGQLVVPRRVHADGEFMTYSLIYAHERDHRRQRRSVESTPPELHFQLPLANETLHLELT